MDCLSPEQLVAYLRTGNGEGRAVEAHVRDCPGCAMELLLARETLGELGPVKAARPGTARKALVRRRVSWVPWAAAAAVLFAVALIVALQSTKKPGGAPVAKPTPAPRTPEPRPEPRPEPEFVKPEPKPEPPKPLPPPKPDPVIAKPEPKPEPPRPEPPKPDPVIAKPEPKPEPPKSEPARPTVEKFAVGKVVHQVGTGANAPGKVLFSRETLATAKNEFVSFELDGYGSLYFNQSSKAEIDVEGAITLHEGEFLGKIDRGRRLAPLKTPAGEVQIQADLFDVQAAKAGTEVSVIEGNAAVGAMVARGPILLMLKPGKLPELKPLEAGFLTWLPERLASKKFSSWIEGETFAPLNGFRALEWDGASARRAAVQTAEQGTAILKSPLPFRAPHVLWLRVRQYAKKGVTMGVQVGGAGSANVDLEGPEDKPWRWVAIRLTSDRVDLGIAALSRFPFQPDERRSAPVVVDFALVTSDTKFAPGDRMPEELRKAFDLSIDEPAK